MVPGPGFGDASAPTAVSGLAAGAEVSSVAVCDPAAAVGWLLLPRSPKSACTGEMLASATTPTSSSTLGNVELDLCPLILGRMCLKEAPWCFQRWQILFPRRLPAPQKIVHDDFRAPPSSCPQPRNHLPHPRTGGEEAESLQWRVRDEKSSRGEIEVETARGAGPARKGLVSFTLEMVPPMPHSVLTSFVLQPLGAPRADAPCIEHREQLILLARIE